MLHQVKIIQQSLVVVVIPQQVVIHLSEGVLVTLHQGILHSLGVEIQTKYVDIMLRIQQLVVVVVIKLYP